MRVVLTGAGGFLGWHVRLYLNAHTNFEVVAVKRDNWSDLSQLLRGADAVIHVAGVNRGSDSEVQTGNVNLAQDLARAMEDAARPINVVYANSVQAGNGTPYGLGKSQAGEILGETARRQGGHLTSVLLPNLFGEHGHPRYNSFIATFIDAVIASQTPQIQNKSVVLLSAQAAARALVTPLQGAGKIVPLAPERRTVREVWELLQEFHGTYPASGEFPDLSSSFRVDVFNAYRAALFPSHYPIALTPHSDHRGSFIETVRSRGGDGQASISTTKPGITRGEHYHLRKIERFAVVAGSARISLRRMFSEQIVTFKVSGDRPVAIDMPIGWAHNITNTCDDVLVTQFWAHEVFSPEAPDTFASAVKSEPIEKALL